MVLHLNLFLDATVQDFILLLKLKLDWNRNQGAFSEQNTSIWVVH